MEMPRGGRYRVNALETVPGFIGLTAGLDEYKLLENSTYFYFNSPQWVKSSWEKLEEAKGSRPFILLAEDADGTLAGWWPLLISPRHLGSRLQSFGQEYSDYSSPFVFNDRLDDYAEIVYAMLEHVRMNKTRFSMGFLQNLYLLGMDEGTVRALLAGSRGNWSLDRKAANHYIDFTGSGNADDIAAKNLSAKFRKNLSYETRRLELMGDISHTLVNGEEGLRAVEDFYRKNYKYASPGKKAPKLDVWMDFFRHSLGGLTHISVLRHKGRILNAIVYFRRAAEIDFFSTVYDTGFGKYSPGKIHLYYLVGELCGGRYVRLNFLTGDEKYKRQWSNGEYYTYKAFFHHRSNLSGLLLSLKRLFKKG